MNRWVLKFGQVDAAGVLVGLVLLVMACGGQANPLILFKPGSEQQAGTASVLVLPLGGHVTLTALTSRCRSARGDAVRVYDLENEACGGVQSIGPSAAHLPSLDQTLQGSALTGQPVQVALDAGLFVWYDLTTSRACVVGSCTSISTSVLSVSISSFTADPTAILAGATTLLSWTTSAATSCELGDDQGGASVSVSNNGSVSRMPLVTTVFTLTCQGNNGPASSDASVTVTQPPAEDIFADGFESSPAFR